jgi:phosphoribosylamine--glycine ligase
MLDALLAAGIPCFGPSAAAAQLEASKVFAKEFMARHNIPTARFETFSSFEKAEHFIRTCGYPVVIKASGLAAGKGVVVPDNVDEAVKAAREMLEARIFGEAGAHIVVEERLDGPEASVLAFCDGKTAIALPPAQDHKRANAFNRGLNTGGMGAYAPAPIVTPTLLETIMNTIVSPAVSGMAKEGNPFVGVLFAGIMLTANGPRALEFNVRMGDPETEAVLPLLSSDLLAIAQACVKGQLSSDLVQIKKNAVAATIVTAASGYPGTPRKGDVITLPAPNILGNNAMLFHAGTSLNNSGDLVTSGGRVLVATGVAPSLSSALQVAHNVLDHVNFSGAWRRRDIAGRWVRPRAAIESLRIGVIGSTRGTDLIPILKAISSGELTGAQIVHVISNKADAGILEKAREANIPSTVISANGKTREEWDTAAADVFDSANVDLVLCIGFMRIFSKVFVDRFAWRCLNVHPSLLPAFAGGMDTDVHAVSFYNK